MLVQTDTFMVCMRLLWNDFTASREAADKLRGCFIMKGHYDKGQGIISMASSLPPSPKLQQYKKTKPKTLSSKSDLQSLQINVLPHCYYQLLQHYCPNYQGDCLIITILSRHSGHCRERETDRGIVSALVWVLQLCTAAQPTHVASIC